jgi:AcrR family transcriptional regulator
MTEQRGWHPPRPPSQDNHVSDPRRDDDVSEQDLGDAYASLEELRDAFVSLALERGIDEVSISDIVERAHVRRESFLAHYPDKIDFVAEAFRTLIDDLSTRLELNTGPWTKVRTHLVELLYQHASEHRDIYLVCLHGTSGSRARQEYQALVTRAAEENFEGRIQALGTTPRVPVTVMAHVAAGAHMALLELWLSGELPYTVEEVAAVGLNLLICGMAWGHGLSLDQIELASQ